MMSSLDRKLSQLTGAQKEVKFSSYDNTSVVYAGVTVGENVYLGHFVLLYPNLKIGDNVVIEDRVTLGENYDEGLETVIGSDSKIYNGTIIQGGVVTGNNLFVGSNALIRRSSTLGEKVVLGSGSEIGANVKIGSDVKMNSQVFVPDYTEIEDHVYLGPYAVITNTHHPRCSEVLNCIPKAAVKIRKYAKIGAGAIILPSVEIGVGAIVAAGAVVRKNVEAKTVVAGNPAEKIMDVKDIKCRLTIGLVDGNPYKDILGEI